MIRAATLIVFLTVAFSASSEAPKPGVTVANFTLYDIQRCDGH